MESTSHTTYTVCPSDLSMMHFSVNQDGLDFPSTTELLICEVQTKKARHSIRPVVPQSVMKSVGSSEDVGIGRKKVSIPIYRCYFFDAIFRTRRLFVVRLRCNFVLAAFQGCLFLCHERLIYICIFILVSSRCQHETHYSRLYTYLVPTREKFIVFREVSRLETSKLLSMFTLAPGARMSKMLMRDIRHANVACFRIHACKMRLSTVCNDKYDVPGVRFPQ